MGNCIAFEQMRWRKEKGVANRKRGEREDRADLGKQLFRGEEGGGKETSHRLLISRVIGRMPIHPGKQSSE